jgi:hypothetical protein
MRHRVAFRQRPHDQGPFRHAGQRARGQVFARPELCVVDLVRDQPEVVVAHHAGHILQRAAGVDGSGRVVGRIDQQRPRARRAGCDFPCLGLEPGFGAGRHRHVARAGRADRARVGGVIGVAVKAGVAGVERYHMRGEKCRLPARRHHHVFGSGGDAGTRRHPFGDGAAQVGLARADRVAGVARPRAGRHRVKNAGIGADVVFADGQVDHRHPARLQVSRAIVDLPPVRPVARHVRDATCKLHVTLRSVRRATDHGRARRARGIGGDRGSIGRNGGLAGLLRQARQGAMKPTATLCILCITG